MDSGSTVDAVVSREMLENIFYPKAPLHDGAVVIRDGRIHSAACILPLTKNTNISLALGTRHRAAIGMSENSDATIVVVSEETGTVRWPAKATLSGALTPSPLKPSLKAPFRALKRTTRTKTVKILSSGWGGLNE